MRPGRQRQDAGWTFLASDRVKIRVATIGRPHAGSAPQSPLSKLPLRSGFLARLTSTPLGPDDARQKAVSAREQPRDVNSSIINLEPTHRPPRLA
jgi:hypothetical protein